MVQALLGEWRAELARKPLSMTEADACQVLGVSPNEQGHVDEEALKAAYRCNGVPAGAQDASQGRIAGCTFVGR